MSFQKGKKNHPSYTAQSNLHTAGKKQQIWPSLALSLPTAKLKSLGAKRRSGSSAASAPQSSRPQRNVVDWEALMYLQLRTTSAPAHLALPSLPTLRVLRRKELSQKRIFIFVKSLKWFFSSSVLLSPPAPQQLSSAWPLTAGRCSLRAGQGSWPQRARTSPQTAGMRWLLGGTCSSSLCLLSAKAPPPAVTQPAGLVRACETFSRPHPDPEAEPSSLGSTQRELSPCWHFPPAPTHMRPLAVARRGLATQPSWKIWVKRFSSVTHWMFGAPLSCCHRLPHQN